MYSCGDGRQCLRLISSFFDSNPANVSHFLGERNLVVFSLLETVLVRAFCLEFKANS